MSAGSSPSLDVLLDHLKRSRGFDFTGYKRSTLERRIAKRMEEVGVEDFAAYLDHLEVHPDEFAFLFNTILINVTSFFRDRPAWDFLRTEAVPQLLEALGPDAPVRVWCAGCASGEETYSTAILLAEALGDQAFLERVKIYATDVDEEALNEARAASYPAKALEGLDPALRDKYFDRVEQRYVFRKDLRRVVIFGRNDLVQDAPISRIDLLTCRNTLMYFNAETQARILDRFHFGLNDHGLLFLGKSEMLLSHAERFRPLNLKCRVFTKVVKSTMRERLSFVTNGVHAALEGDGAVRDAALDASPVAQIAVDTAGTLVAANAAARALFSLTPEDLGRPLEDLELSYRPVDLRSRLDQVINERRGAAVRDVGYAAGNGEEPVVLDVHVAPLVRSEEVLGVTIAFEDVTQARRMRDDLEASKRELENAYEELQSTVEELETTNEELQSTNEELETTNEELQSTNEELETMNEELQSTNEELETINEELRQRTLELNEVNGFLEAILTSMGVAVVVVDTQMTVQVWNGHATDLWGLRADEVEGQHVLNLDIGLPVDRLRPGLRDVLAGRSAREEVELIAVNRRGKRIRCRVAMLPLTVGKPPQTTGAILLTEGLDG